MAKMPLRRAQQIGNRITAEAAFEVDRDDERYAAYGRKRTLKVKTLNPTASVNIDGNPLQRVNQLREALLERFEQKIRLIDIGTRIRTAIGQTNAECGVAKLMTERVGLLNQQRILEYLLESTENGPLDKNEFSDQVLAMKTRLANSTQGAATAQITTVLLLDQDRQTFRPRLDQIKRNLLEVEDQIARLNVENSIEVSEQDLDYLRNLSIA